MKNFFQNKLILACLLGFVAFGARAQVGLPPVITVQPLGLSVSQGDTVVLTVVAVSLTSMSYKWYCDNHEISGATGSILTINSANSGRAGTYRVEVKNSSGTSVSANAAVVVLPKVKIHLPIKTAKMKSQGFEIQLENLTAPKCVVYASTDMVNWSPIATNSVVAGAVTYTDTTAVGRPCRYYKVMDE